MGEEGSGMKFEYYPETDSLYIELRVCTSAETIVVNDDMNVDVDDHGVPIGIDIHQNASKLVELGRLDLGKVPIESIGLKNAM